MCCNQFQPWIISSAMLINMDGQHNARIISLREHYFWFERLYSCGSQLEAGSRTPEAVFCPIMPSLLQKKPKLYFTIGFYLFGYICVWKTGCKHHTRMLQKCDQWSLSFVIVICILDKFGLCKLFFPFTNTCGVSPLPIYSAWWINSTYNLQKNFILLYITIVKHFEIGQHNNCNRFSKGNS